MAQTTSRNNPDSIGATFMQAQTRGYKPKTFVQAVMASNVADPESVAETALRGSQPKEVSDAQWAAFQSADVMSKSNQPARNKELRRLAGQSGNRPTTPKSIVLDLTDRTVELSEELMDGITELFVDVINHFTEAALSVNPPEMRLQVDMGLEAHDFDLRSFLASDLRDLVNYSNAHRATEVRQSPVLSRTVDGTVVRKVYVDDEIQVPKLRQITAEFGKRISELQKDINAAVVKCRTRPDRSSL
jgi:hypothetical protein